MRHTNPRPLASNAAQRRNGPAHREQSRGAEEARKWFESLAFVLEYILRTQSSDQAAYFMDRLIDRLREEGIHVPPQVSTPYLNTIPGEEEPPYPGDRELERRIKSYIRWNAMAMVVNA